ncbi:MAG: peptidase M50, partial [Pseudomonadota bacterium]
ALFMAQRCALGLKEAKALQGLERMPRHRDFSCPSCHQAPLGGPYWQCASCNNHFDPFSTQAICPHCRARQPATPCPLCSAVHPVEQWSGSRR